jgi:hypothetical protein
VIRRLVAEAIELWLHDADKVKEAITTDHSLEEPEDMLQCVADHDRSRDALTRLKRRLDK